MNSFNLENLQSLPPIEFENLVKTLLEKMGFRAETTKISGDGGIDIVATNEQPIVSGKYVIQCKKYATGNNVGEPVIRELYGVMMHENANKGILITTSDFSKKAVSFAQYKAIELINGSFIVELLNKYLADTEHLNDYLSQECEKGNSKRVLELNFKFYELTVLEENTNLIWAKDANLAGKDMTWQEAKEFIAQLNICKYADVEAWRLPSLNELENIAAFAKYQGVENKINAFFNRSGFNNVQYGYYWSSTTTASEIDRSHLARIYRQNGIDNRTSEVNANEADGTWGVSLMSGGALYGSKQGRAFLWPCTKRITAALTEIE